MEGKPNGWPLENQVDKGKDSCWNGPEGNHNRMGGGTGLFSTSEGKVPAVLKKEISAEESLKAEIAQKIPMSIAMENHCLYALQIYIRIKT